ncbi:MAG TPA: hypothetical protein VGJ53_02575 [Micromonosporaceae bacterium]
MSEWSVAGGAWTDATRRAQPAAWRGGKAASVGGAERANREAQ